MQEQHQGVQQAAVLLLLLPWLVQALQEVVLLAYWPAVLVLPLQVLLLV
jgi:hypothetical protein